METYGDFHGKAAGGSAGSREVQVVALHRQAQLPWNWGKEV
jgi:hypothetical protein